jgi:hypothetical protein
MVCDDIPLRSLRWEDADICFQGTAVRRFADGCREHSASVGRRVSAQSADHLSVKEGWRDGANHLLGGAGAKRKTLGFEAGSIAVVLVGANIDTHQLTKRLSWRKTS